ncbi:exopolysaccharide biosynthesis protein, WecB/TagA/CpsF family [Pseudomonas sp. GM78]|uniref:WecB/TagA/CpsF family glycosyltransferase n=1 Tax=Pseudomonas sp. GM78 TaxID=1144337 RepID=UPI0002706279|nr:WecB/TagA/CpsF family glycosyltransferase [Pseudomonas sp. GM78]EJN23719.1 exopolysaccharide biosynthesis protein, WecB/TagA/CpsF family [Pseudomonas sp. GM78]
MRTLAWQHNWQTIIQTLRVIKDADQEQRLIETLSRPQRATVLGFVNAHAMNLVAKDNAYYQALSAADVLLRDGSGMSILFRRMGREPGLNMNGTDLIPKLLSAYKGRRVALWGTQEPFLGNAAKHCETALAVNLVSAHHGFADVETYLTLARQHQPELIVLGMGMPRQEVVAARLAASGVPCLIVCGGAILDFLGGKVNRAPQWMRGLGCEWVFRLVSEPKRLFSRYVVGNPMFILRTLACTAPTGG